MVFWQFSFFFWQILYFLHVFRVYVRYFSLSYCFRPLKLYCVFSVMFIVSSNTVTVNPECLFCSTRPLCWLSIAAVHSLSGQMLLYYHTFPLRSHTCICSVVLTHFTMATILFHVLCVLLKRSERWASPRREETAICSLWTQKQRLYPLPFSPLFSTAVLLFVVFHLRTKRQKHFLPFLFPHCSICLLCAKNARVCCCWV